MPVCLVCLCFELLRQQIELRRQVDNNNLLDITPALDWYAELNTAREKLGYSQLEFDDRDWGFNFGDEDEEDYKEEGDEDDLGGQHVVREANGSVWQLPPDEAMDADAVNVTSRSPAASDDVDALLRRTLNEAELQIGGAIECGVCKDAMLEKQALAEMPCSHFHHDQCIQDWLADHRTCPICRFTLPGADDDEAPESDDDSERRVRTPGKTARRTARAAQTMPAQMKTTSTRTVRSILSSSPSRKRPMESLSFVWTTTAAMSMGCESTTRSCSC